MKGVKVVWDDTWILEHWDEYEEIREMMVDYNAAHDAVTYTTFYAHCRNALGVRKMKEYTDEQKAFIREHYPVIGGEKTTELFNKKFGTDKTVMAIRGYGQKMGLNVEKDTVLRVRREGIIRYMDAHCKPEDWKVPRVKDSDGNWCYAWVEAYKKAYGDIPKGFKVFHLDRNIKNNSEENLVAIPEAYIMRMNKNGFHSKNPDINRGVIAWCSLREKIKEVERG